MQKEFQTIIVPILKGLPITIILIILSITFAARIVIYTVPEYQSTGSIKIDNRNINLGDLALFEEEGRTKGATSVDFLTEVEMFKSKRLKELTFKKLNFNIDYFRIGKIKTVELYKNNPIEIDYTILDKQAYDKFYFLKYVNEGELIWSKNETDFFIENKIQIGDTIRLEEIDFVVNKNVKVLLENENSLRTGDVFAFKLNSVEALVKSVNDDNYFVRSVDKKIQIINLYYQHKVPEKAALYINALMETYIDDCKNRHREEADKTIDFIDSQLNNVKLKLKNSEGQLVKFKTQKSIMNIKQETDALLKEMMQLEFQKVNYDMQEAELKRTFEYLVGGNDLRDFAPNFEALKDPLFRETFMKAQNYELTRQDLLLKYTPQHDEVLNIERKIKSMRTFINESVKNTLENVASRKKEMTNSIAAVAQNIQDFPDKEQQTTVLSREVKLNEQLYTSLIEKKMEIGVAKSANTVYHQVVDKAEVNETPISPNKSLMYGVSVFFALLIGIGLSFLKHFLTAKIKSKNDLVQVFKEPIIGTVGRVKKNENTINAIGNLYTNLELIMGRKEKNNKGKTVMMSSMLPGEGKTFSTVNLAKVYASMGKRVLIIDMDVETTELHDWLGIENVRGLSALFRNEITPHQSVVKTNIKNLDVIPSGNINDIYSGILFAPQTTSFIETLKEDYDIILIDAPAIGLVEDVTLMMQQVDFNLLVFRAKKTKIKTAKIAQRIVEEYEIPNVYGVFNGVKKGKANMYLNSISIKRRVWDAVFAGA